MKIDHKMRVPFNHHMHTRKVLFGHANVNKKALIAQNVRTYVNISSFQYHQKAK